MNNNFSTITSIPARVVLISTAVRWLRRREGGWNHRHKRTQRAGLIVRVRRVCVHGRALAAVGSGLGRL
jgi:hypothetical protein